MVRIDDAGTGCILGVPVVVGEKNGVVEYVEIKDLQGVIACDEVFELLNKLGVEKEEEINICRGNIFNKFVHKAKQEGYNNINRVVVTDEMQDTAENIFMNSLYDLGVSRDIVLENKDYVKLHESLCSELLRKPHLIKYVRSHYKLNKHFTRLIYKIDRLHNEFPHLLSELLDKKSL